MGYHAITVDELSATPDRPCERRAISDAAELESANINRYDVAPGEQIPLAYHYHDEQEELFYVLSGTLSVETPEGEYTIDADEVFIAEPDSPHRAYNPDEAEETVRVLAIGAPPLDDVHPYEP
ncbi:cupin domain-containing protein [Halalkalicoccus salilacus]|uniref:cupin domain-containing protein n=1 Tax=Halalkalicoccus TaxID=332246 RepID=UPI002F96AE02